MKNFICFLFCSFLMLFASVNVQASVSEPISPKSMDVSAMDAPIVQGDAISVTSMSFIVMDFTQSYAFSTVAEIPIMQSPTVSVPKCPFRYLYQSRYNTHYSCTAYSRLITPY